MMLRSTLSERLLAVAFAIAVSVVAVVSPILLAPAPALAIPQPGSCLGGTDYGELHASQQDAYAGTNRGTAADVRVISNSLVSCQHVASIYARAVLPGQGGIEFAYVIGYSNCSTMNGIYYTTPKLFWWAYFNDGRFAGCGALGQTADASTQKFSVADTNDNGYWNAFLNNNSLGLSKLLDFHVTDNWWSIERATSADSGYARFDNLSEFHTGTNGWSLWDSQFCGGGPNPGYSCSHPNPWTGISS